jgi:hypothetical protein
MPGVEWGRLKKKGMQYANYIRSVNYNLSRYMIFMAICVICFHRESDDWRLGWYPMFRKKHILMVRFDVQSLCTWDDDDDDYYYCCCSCYDEDY